MNNINFTQQSNYSTGVNVNSFMANVFAWMFLALALTAGAAYYFATDAALMSTLVTTTGLSGLGYVVMFAPLIFAFAMSAGFNRFSYNLLVTLYVSYALIMGISFSVILLAYTVASIFKTFSIKKKGLNFSGTILSNNLKLSFGEQSLEFIEFDTFGLL
jgi:FtsH-binding integral membrane protein